MSTRILLADDSSVMRNAIVRLLKDEPSCEVVGEASGFAETIKLAAVLKPDVLLLDLHMPDEREYPPHVVRLKIRGHAQHILALSIWNGDKAESLAGILGAQVLLDKTKLFSELIPAIRNCCGSLPKRALRLRKSPKKFAAPLIKARSDAA
jgi:DNA-binding NarL/FixJ family response regulator